MIGDQQPERETPKESLLPLDDGRSLTFERLILRTFLGPYKSKQNPLECSKKRFHRVHRQILKEIKSLTPEELEEQVLISTTFSKIQGKYPMSIHRSICNMMAVGEIIKFIAIELSHNRKIQQQFLPDNQPESSNQSATETLQHFYHYVEKTMDELDEKMKDDPSAATHPHPWYGPLTCQQWHWLLTVHGAIHLLEIREIKKGLHGRSH